MSFGYEDLAGIEGTAAEIAAYFSAEVSLEDPRPKLIADIVAALSNEEELLVLGTIKQAAAVDPRIDATWIAMSSVGIQLHTAERQTQIEQLGAAGNWGGTLIAKVKQIGRPLKTRWASLGKVGLPPTAQQISAVIAAKAAADALAEVDAARVAVENEILNAAYVAADRTKASLAAAYRAAADALEAE